MDQNANDSRVPLKWWYCQMSTGTMDIGKSNLFVFSPAVLTILNLSPIVIEAVNYLCHLNAQHCRSFDDNVVDDDVDYSLFVHMSCHSILCCTIFLYHLNGRRFHLIDYHRSYLLNVQNHLLYMNNLLPFHQSSVISLVIYHEIQIMNQNHRQYCDCVDLYSTVGWLIGVFMLKIDSRKKIDEFNVYK